MSFFSALFRWPDHLHQSVINFLIFITHAKPSTCIFITLTYPFCSHHTHLWKTPRYCLNRWLTLNVYVYVTLILSVATIPVTEHIPLFLFQWWSPLITSLKNPDNILPCEAVFCVSPALFPCLLKWSQDALSSFTPSITSPFSLITHYFWHLAPCGSAKIGTCPFFLRIITMSPPSVYVFNLQTRLCSCAMSIEFSLLLCSQHGVIRWQLCILLIFTSAIQIFSSTLSGFTVIT